MVPRGVHQLVLGQPVDWQLQLAFSELHLFLGAEGLDV